MSIAELNSEMPNESKDSNKLSFSHHRSVLVVDDEAGIVESLKRIFNREGIEVQVANNGE